MHHYQGFCKHVIKKTLRATFFYMKNQITLFNNKVWSNENSFNCDTWDKLHNFVAQFLRKFYHYEKNWIFDGILSNVYFRFNATHTYEECYQWVETAWRVAWISLHQFYPCALVKLFRRTNKTKKLEQKSILMPNKKSIFPTCKKRAVSVDLR